MRGVHLNQQFIIVHADLQVTSDECVITATAQTTVRISEWSWQVSLHNSATLPAASFSLLNMHRTDRFRASARYAHVYLHIEKFGGYGDKAEPRKSIPFQVSHKNMQEIRQHRNNLTRSKWSKMRWQNCTLPNFLIVKFMHRFRYSRAHDARL